MEPVVQAALPGMPFSTGRLGSGSDVLGLDDAVSRDHDWGLRLTVIVPADRVAAVDRVLQAQLPAAFAGYPVRFATTWSSEVRQQAEVVSAQDLSRSRCGIDATRPLGLLDHLALTGQARLELTAGPVFRDEQGVLARLRLALEQPEDVRLWALAAAWSRLGQELPFVGRTGERGDALGSRLLTARLVATAMRIGFLLARTPAPYAKWLGTAFAALPLPGEIGSALGLAAGADDWRAAEGSLTDALELLAHEQGRLGLPTLIPATEPFWLRPYRGVRPVAEVLRKAIADPVLRRAPLIGTPDLWTDDVLLLTDHAMRRRATAAALGIRQDGDDAAARGDV